MVHDKGTDGHNLHNIRVCTQISRTCIIFTGSMRKAFRSDQGVSALQIKSCFCVVAKNNLASVHVHMYTVSHVMVVDHNYDYSMHLDWTGGLRCVN